MKQTIARWGLFLLVAACSAHPIEVGTGQDRPKPPGQLPPPSHGADEPPLPEWPDPDACAEQSDLPIKGVWDGYFGRFRNPVADFRIDIRGASEAGGLCGTITYEPSQPPPPPLTDPTTWYPSSSCGQACDLVPGPPALLSGFPFTILKGRAQGTHIEFFMARAQPWQAWCEAQPTYADEHNAGRFGCLPNWGAGSPAACGTGGCCLFDSLMQTVSVDCGRLEHCNLARACNCNAVRCVAWQDPNAQLAFDFTGDTALGEVRISNGPRDALLVRVQ